MDYSYSTNTTNENNPLNLYEKQIPVTITWSVNAWAKVQRSLPQKIKSLCGRSDDEENIRYKQILTNVNGIVKPGQLCAIMGASGSGKTTLLNILNFRNQGKLKIDGEVKLNGELADWDKITRYSGYVQQDDLFNATLTVREHLTFMAMLKMGSNFTIEERHQRVDQVIIELNLIKAEHTIIGMGDRLKGISGGEKRRLAFASEIITNPPILFCDEPTSGLDSFMAQSLVESMASLTAQGKAVICTIHQPSSQTFELFDTLILLAEGRLAYLGPTNEAERYFANLGYQVPELYNPSDYYIQTLAVAPLDRENSLLRVKQITDSFEQSPQYAKMMSDIKQAEYNNMEMLDISGPKYSTGYLSQLYWLLWRQIKLDLRSQLGTKVLAIQSIFIAVFLGLIFLRLKFDEVGVQNRTGVLFITLMQCNFGFIFGVVNTFPSDLILIYRESKNRLYSIIPYYFVKQIAEFPKYIIFPFIFITIVYWMSGLYDDGVVFIEITLTLLLVVQIAISYGLFVSSIAPNLDAALAMVVPIMMPLLIFGGFFLNSDTTPVYFIWIKYLSWFFYANEIINVLLWRKIKSIPCSKPAPPGPCAVSSCYQDGQDVLKSLSFSESNLARNFLVMIALLIGFRLLALLALKFRLSRS